MSKKVSNNVSIVFLKYKSMNNNKERAIDLPISIIVEKSVEKAIKHSFDDIHKKLDKLQTTIYKINGEKTYTIKEVASLTNRNYYTIRQHIQDKMLKAARKGKNYTIRQEHFEEYLTKTC